MVFDSSICDNITWGVSKKKFSTMTAYNLMSGLYTHMRCKWHTVVWRKESIATDNLLLWRVVNNALFTKVKFLCRGMNMKIICCYCGDLPVTFEHLFSTVILSVGFGTELSMC